MENGTIVNKYIANTHKGTAGILIYKCEDNSYHSAAFILSELDNYNMHFYDPLERSAYEKAEKWVREIDDKAVFRLIPET